MMKTFETLLVHDNIGQNLVLPQCTDHQTERSSKLAALPKTYKFQNIKKVSEVMKKKCSYFNSGFCKLAVKKTGCKSKHLKKDCTVPNGQNKACTERHPNQCQFGEKCRKP